MNFQDLTPVVILAMCIYLLIKDLLVPLVRKRLNNNPEVKEDKSVNLEVFYQEFTDFKGEMRSFKEQTKEDFKELEEQVNKLRNRRQG